MSAEKVKMRQGCFSEVDLCTAAHGNDICMPGRISIKALFPKPVWNFMRTHFPES